MREEVVPRRVVELTVEVDRLGLELANVGPDRELVKHHLEIVVVGYRLLEQRGLRMGRRGPLGRSLPLQDLG